MTEKIEMTLRKQINALTGEQAKAMLIKLIEGKSLTHALRVAKDSKDSKETKAKTSI